jgi:hypothetical protein
LVFPVDLPVNTLAAFEFLVMKLLSFERLIFPLDDLTLAGAIFKALDKLDFETPKVVATSLTLRSFAEPWANTA